MIGFVIIFGAPFAVASFVLFHRLYQVDGYDPNHLSARDHAMLKVPTRKLKATVLTKNRAIRVLLAKSARAGALVVLLAIAAHGQWADPTPGHSQPGYQQPAYQQQSVQQFKQELATQPYANAVASMNDGTATRAYNNNPQRQAADWAHARNLAHQWGKIVDPPAKLPYTTETLRRHAIVETYHLKEGTPAPHAPVWMPATPHDLGAPQMKAPKVRG